MTKIYYACDEIPRSWQKYFGRCNAVEIDLTRLANPPKTETLNRWRVESPKGFAFCLHAHPAVTSELQRLAQDETPSELSQELLDGWQNTLDTAKALAAKAIVVSTPDPFTPSQRSRAAMELFAETCAAQTQAPVIWEAAGVWDPQHTREWAQERGLVSMFDPFLALRDEIGFLHGDGAFLVSERGGVRREFDSYEISRLLDQLGSYNRAFFFLRGRFKWNHADIFRQLVE